MVDKVQIANIMDVLVTDCNECPLERICNEGRCVSVWERFFDSKVKEDGVEQCRN